MITLYGIKNCNTVKKAMQWLDGRGVAYRFHDFRKDGTDPEQLELWIGELGSDTLFNKRGPTWRKIPEARKENLDREAAVALMLEYPTAIKRPVLDLGDRRIVGFKEQEYAEIFQ